MIFHQLSIALGVISLIGFFASSGKQRMISGFLLAFCLIMGIGSYQPTRPPADPSTDKSQAAPAELEQPVHKEPVLPLTPNPVYLTKSGAYKVNSRINRLCFSWLGHDTGYVNQGLTINGIEYKTAMGGGGACYKLVTSNDIIEVKFLNPYNPEERDTYAEISQNEPGGQGLYPFIEPIKQ